MQVFFLLFHILHLSLKTYLHSSLSIIYLNTQRKLSLESEFKMIKSTGYALSMKWIFFKKGHINGRKSDV